MNILITGATGFVGRRLCRVLAEGGHNLTCFVRKNSDVTYLEGFSIIKGSLLDKNLLKSIKNIDMVFHLAALRGERHLPFKEYEKINVLATENLLEIFKNSRFVYCSTVGVMGYGTCLCETSPLRPTGNYHITKSISEKLCRKHRGCIIIRPSIVYGPGDRDGFLYKLIKLIDRKRFLIIGKGKNRIHMVHIENLARGMKEIAMKGKEGEVYIIADRASLTVEEITGIIAKKLNKKIPPIRIPVIIARTLALIYESIFSFIFPGKEPFLSVSKVDIISREQDFCIKKALLAGYRPEIEVSKGIEEEIEWMKKEKT